MGVDVLRVAASLLVVAGIVLLLVALIELIVMAATPADSGEAPTIASPGRLVAWGVPGMVFLALGAYLHASLQAADESEEGEADPPR